MYPENQGLNNPQQGTTPTEEVSKEELIRQLIVGPERREMEAQLNGMKDLFASIIAQNKQDYANQLNEMKGIFTNILQENRLMFQQQIQELTQTLPSLVKENVAATQDEKFIYLTQQSTADLQRRHEEVNKMTRVDALKEIIGGQDVRTIEEKIAQLKNLQQQYQQQQIQMVQSWIQRIATELQAMQQRSDLYIEQSCVRIGTALQQHDKSQVQRRLFARMIQEVADRIAE